MSRAHNLGALHTAPSGGGHTWPKPQRRDYAGSSFNLHKPSLLQNMFTGLVWPSLHTCAQRLDRSPTASQGTMQVKFWKHLKLFRWAFGYHGKIGFVMNYACCASRKLRADYICILSNFSASLGSYLSHDPPGKHGSLKVGPVTKCMTKITEELRKKHWNSSSKSEQKCEAEQRDGSSAFNVHKEREYFKTDNSSSHVEKDERNFGWLWEECHTSITKKNNVFCCLRIFGIDTKTLNCEPGVVAHTWILALGRLRQEDCCEFELS